MALLRYAAQEARNISRAKAQAEQQSKVDAFVQARKAFVAVTKSSLGLGNVDNTSDADKPVSTAAQGALDGKASLVAVTTIATDAAETVTPTATTYQVLHTGTLTAPRTLTLATAGQIAGSVIRFTRTGPGAFNLSVGALKALPTNTWCDVVFDGSAWVITANGSL